MSKSCRGVLMIGGASFPCDWPTDEKGKHPGWAHANSGVQAIWGKNNKPRDHLMNPQRQVIETQQMVRDAWQIGQDIVEANYDGSATFTGLTPDTPYTIEHNLPTQDIVVDPKPKDDYYVARVERLEEIIRNQDLLMTEQQKKLDLYQRGQPVGGLPTEEELDAVRDELKSAKAVPFPNDWLPRDQDTIDVRNSITAAMLADAEADPLRAQLEDAKATIAVLEQALELRDSQHADRASRMQALDSRLRIAEESVEAQRRETKYWVERGDREQERSIKFRDARNALAEAIRLTVEYVGTDTLQPVEGWAWFDALTKHAPMHLAGLVDEDGKGKIPLGDGVEKRYAEAMAHNPTSYEIAYGKGYQDGVAQEKANNVGKITIPGDGTTVVLHGRPYLVTYGDDDTIHVDPKPKDIDAYLTTVQDDGSAGSVVMYGTMLRQVECWSVSDDTVSIQLKAEEG